MRCSTCSGSRQLQQTAGKDCRYGYKIDHLRRGELGLGLFSRIFQDLKALQAQLLGPEVDVVSSIAHFCEYTVLGALLANALRCHMPLRRACLVAVACASLYGASDEFHQLFVPGRMCDPMDWLVDTAGAALGSGLAYLQLRRKGREGKEQPGEGSLTEGE